MVHVWKTTKLGEVAEVIDCPHSTPKWTTEGYFVVRNYNLSGGRIAKDNPSYTDEQNYFQRIRRAKPQKGDIILSREAPIGALGFVADSEDICLGQRVVLIRPQKCDPQFLLYEMLSPAIQNEFKIAGASGSVVSNFRIPQIKSLEVILPSLPEQKAIAGVLSGFDDKIDLLRRQNKTLEAIAQTLFKEWFVNFRIENEPLKIDKKTALPEGWKRGKIKDVVNILSGFAFSSSDFVQSGKYKLVTIKNVQDRHFDPETKDFLCTPPLKMPAYCHLLTGNILLSLTGNVGRVCLVVGENYLLNQRVAKLKPIRPTDYAFCYLLFLQKAIFTHLQNIASGTAQQNLSPIQTKEIEIVLPESNILDQFGSHAIPLIEKINLNNMQIQTLSKLRDTLLPKLMKGEIRIKA